MQNHRTAIIKGFASALSGLTYGGQSIPVFSASPTKAHNKPYIQIGTVTSSEEGCKDAFAHACTIDIQVIDNTKKNYTSPKVSEEITDLVLAAIKPTVTSVVSLADPFEMKNLLLSNSFHDLGIFETDRYYRNILQWSFDVYQIPELIWILEGGIWNDDGVWVDVELWQD